MQILQIVWGGKVSWFSWIDWKLQKFSSELIGVVMWDYTMQPWNCNFFLANHSWVPQLQNFSASLYSASQFFNLEVFSCGATQRSYTSMYFINPWIFIKERVKRWSHDHIFTWSYNNHKITWSHYQITLCAINISPLGYS